MSLDRSNIDASLDTNVNTNGSQAITGAILNAELKKITANFANLVDEAHKLGIREYDPTKEYANGQGTFYSGAIYQAKFDGITGAFDSNKWLLIVQITSPDNYDFVPYDNATTYNENDRVLYQNRFYICNVDNTLGIAPDDSLPEWTEVSASSGTFGAPWEAGYYLDSQVVSFGGFLYVLANPTPPSYNSTDISAEITAGDWVLFHDVGGAGGVPTLEQVLTAGQNTGVRNITFSEQTGIIWTEFGKPNAFMQTAQEASDPRLRIQFDNMAFIQFQDAAYEKGYRFKAEDVRIYQGASNKSMNFEADIFNFIGNTGAFPSAMNFSLRPDANGFFYYFNFANGIRANNETKGVSFKSGSQYINLIAGAGQTASYDVRFPVKPAGTKTIAFTEDIPTIPPPPDLSPYAKYSQQVNSLSIVLPLGLSNIAVFTIPEDGDYIVEWSCAVGHQDDVTMTFDMLENYNAGGSGNDGNNSLLFEVPQIGGGAGASQNNPAMKKGVIRSFLTNDTITVRANVGQGTVTLRNFVAHLIKVG